MTRLLAAALLLAGCASSAPNERARPPESTLPSNDELEMKAAHDEVRRLDSLLSDAEVQATAPDCTRIAQLRDNICDLATRICQISGRQPAQAGEPKKGSWLCIDGKLRCKNAVEGAQARGCPPPKR